jgi:Glycosyl hydrolase family 12
MLKRAFTLVATTAALLMCGTAAFASIPPHPKWESSARTGTWNHNGYLFQNDMWNCPQAACGKQTIWANAPSDWGVVSTMAAGNTAVLTYPDIGKLYNDKRVSSFKLVRDGFTESMPRSLKGLRAEAANDVWLNHWNIEMMIWVDTVGRSLAGGTRIGSATISGQHFSVWKFGGSEFIFKLNHNETSGQTHILASINWLINHHRVPANATLTQAEFGWEIASTNGRPANFHISKFWLNATTR